jgi:hypothetical protein
VAAVASDLMRENGRSKAPVLIRAIRDRHLASLITIGPVLP